MPGHKPSPLLILLSAPSGGGKTTLCRQLLARHPGMVRAVTCTTRQPRPGERQGVDYHFLDAATFHQRVRAGAFLEHATVYGHSYGVLKSELLGELRRGRDVLLSVDVQGAATLRDRAAREAELERAMVTIFLTPAALEVLAERLRQRGLDSEATIAKRLSVAREEIAQSVQFDYLLISTTIAEDLRRMQTIIEAERMRQKRVQHPEL